MLGEGCLRAMDCKAGLVKRQNLHLASCFQWLLSKLPQQWGSGGWNGATNKCILYVWVDATLPFWFAWVLHALIWRTSSRLVSFWADSFTTARCLGHCLAAMNGSSLLSSHCHRQAAPSTKAGLRHLCCVLLGVKVNCKTESSNDEMLGGGALICLSELECVESSSVVGR